MGKKKLEALEELARQAKEAELTSDYHSHLDEDEYGKMARADPIGVQMIGRMVDHNMNSEEYLSELLYKYPHRWLQTQALKAVIRHLENQRDG